MPRRRSLRRRLMLVFCLPTLGAVGWLLTDRVGYDESPYLRDLGMLEDSVAAGYANLEWQVRAGVVDPVALHRATENRLRAAGSHSAARAALSDFAEAFRDGHFRVERPAPAAVRWLEAQLTGERSTPPRIDGGAEAGCAALGYRDDRSASFLEAHPAYRPLGTTDDAFAIGTIQRGNERLGVLRLDAFGVTRFGTACATAWGAAATAAEDGACLVRCQDALWHATSDTLLATLARRIATLADAGISTLVVDLRGNGGGNDWVTPAARLFTGVPLSGHSAAVVRHPHNVAPLVETIDGLTRATSMTTDHAWREILERARSRAAAQLADVRAPCDRRAVWKAGLVAVACSQLATQGFTTGFTAYLSSAMREMPGAPVVYSPLRFQFTEGVWRGALVLLTDGGTASASEDFVVALKDHGAARVIGQRTYGAGCGYTNGGIGFTLPHSKLEVVMPDCARIRRNGANEVQGIEPDVVVAEDAAVGEWVEAIVGRRS